MIRIERMTAGAIRRGGIDDVRMSLLLRDALKGSGRARRALERAAGEELDLVVPGSADRCPLRHVRLYGQWCDSVLSCRVDIGTGVWWDFDTLHGEMPDTLMTAIPGHALGQIMDHPDADAAAIALEPRERGGILTVKAHHLDPVPTTILQRWQHRRTRLSLLLEESRMEARIPAKYRPMLDALSFITIVNAVIMLHLGQDGWMRVFDTVLGCAAAAYSISNSINARRARPVSMLQAMMPEPRHQQFLEDVRTMRKKP